MRLAPFAFLAAFAAIVIGGCCKPCDSKDYGLFPIQQASRSWISFMGTASLQRTFRNRDSIDRTLSYTPLEDAVNSGVAVNCQDRGACGLCCDSYSEGYLFTQLKNGGTISISIGVVKDFSDHTLSDSASLVPDMLQLTGASGAPLALTPGTTAPSYSSLKIHGRNFANVYQWGTPATPTSPIPSSVSAVYFTTKEGVVGYVTGDGILYGLVR